ncbi:MAG: hypothetical protein MR938_02185 [Tenericutes bacterium]|nr:hypothetical protein [Mycoplasmatota bacterium]
MDSNTAIKKYKKLLNDNTMYKLTGEMDIVSNEELYHYTVTVDYMEGDYYKTSLINKDNRHEQIILKNENGVFVVTPSLNKSFKFQSEWPYNSSQAYILSSLLKDLENDSNVTFEEKEDKYILNSTVNYPNNTALISQKITFDKDMKPQLVEVYNKEGIANITFKISKIDFKPDFKENNFEVENTASEESINNVSKIDEVVYPMYLPTGTKFKSEETVKTDESERVILTFTGDKSFILIEEASKVPKEFEITSKDGELVFYETVLGSLSGSSLNWTMNGKDYYIIGENLSNEELLKVASSTSIVSLTK